MRSLRGGVTGPGPKAVTTGLVCVCASSLRCSKLPDLEGKGNSSGFRSSISVRHMIKNPICLLLLKPSSATLLSSCESLGNASLLYRVGRGREGTWD